MTEKNKLTLADWYKYYEADVQFTTDDNTIQRGYVRAIQVHSDTELEIECFPISFYHKAVSDCKLILRSIDQLTDEEKKYIFRNYLINVEFQYVQWDSFNHLSMYAVDVDADLNYILELTDYLRKKNIMIEKPDWFEIGKAVKDDNNN